MKSLIMLAAAALFLSVAAKDLKVLMIGNSFSVCVGRNLPGMVAHEKKHTLIITSAYIGGCNLERHAELLHIAEQNPGNTSYVIETWDSKTP